MRRLYSEHVPYSSIDTSLLASLAKRRIELAVAVQPSGLSPALEAMVARAGAAGVQLVLWPLLDDAHGRWLNHRNVREFEAHTAQVIRAAPNVRRMVLDLEPPIDWTRAALRGALGRAWSQRPTEASAVRDDPRAQGFASRLRQRGLTVDAVVPPVFAFGSSWERWLGTPVRAYGCARVEVMAYTSLFEGYTAGLVDRTVARDLLATIAHRCAGLGQAVALGVVGGGALGDERAYRDVHELRDDVALCQHAGIQALALYALDGILMRGTPDPWLDAFVQPSDTPIEPRATRRGRALTWAGEFLGGLDRS